MADILHGKTKDKTRDLKNTENRTCFNINSRLKTLFEFHHLPLDCAPSTASATVANKAATTAAATGNLVPIVGSTHFCTIKL